MKEALRPFSFKRVVSTISPEEERKYTQMTGCVNDRPFKGHPEVSVIFNGVTANTKDNGVEVEFFFLPGTEIMIDSALSYHGLANFDTLGV